MLSNLMTIQWEARAARVRSVGCQGNLLDFLDAEAGFGVQVQSLARNGTQLDRFFCLVGAVGVPCQVSEVHESHTCHSVV